MRISCHKLEAAARSSPRGFNHIENGYTELIDRVSLLLEFLDNCPKTMWSHWRLFNSARIWLHYWRLDTFPESHQSTSSTTKCKSIILAVPEHSFRCRPNDRIRFQFINHLGGQHPSLLPIQLRYHFGFKFSTVIQTRCSNEYLVSLNLSSSQFLVWWRSTLAAAVMSKS